MQVEKLKEMYKKYSLDKSDVFKHQHYIIITRSGIEKVMGYEKIDITYDVIKCEPNFSVMKAYAKKGDKVIETFGSALKGASFKDSSTNTWYVAEMAEKRALSRAVLKMTGLYELNIFGEDESEDFKRK
jgi:hypothetical protein